MGLLENFEQRLDHLVNGPFQRVFKDVVEPVEIAARIQQEMDKRAAIISRGRTVVPNDFTVDLSTHDHERLHDLADAIRFELVSVVREHATNQRYTFLGKVGVALAEDPTLDTGVFRVHSETKPDPRLVDHQPGSSTSGKFEGHPHLVIGSTAYQLTKSHTRIGRGSGADIVVNDPAVSRVHAEVILGVPPIVRDLGSANGTTVDGNKVAESPLHDGAQISMGSTTLTFRSG